MATTNVSSQYAGATTRVIAADALKETQRYLVLYQFADKKTIPHGHGVQWEAIRWSRLPLPRSPVAEGVPPDPNLLTFTQVTGTAVQWAGRCVFTDVATITTQQDLMKVASKQLGMQLGEMKERNGMVAAMSGTQVNYANAVGARASLAAGDVLNPTDVARTYANLTNLGAWKYNGQTGEDVQRSISYTARESEGTIKTAEHLVAIGPVFALQDLRNNPLVVQTWQQTTEGHNRLYINQMGYWAGITFCESNMIPSFVGVAQVNGANAVGSLGTATYTIQVTGWDNQNFYESRIYQLSTDISVTTGGISLTTPSTPGFTYAVYVGVGSGAAPARLGLTTSGPTTGPYAGQSIQLPPSTSVTITDLGLIQIPPAAPATGVTVWPTFVFGMNAFACLKLEGVSWNRLVDADKSDPHNMLRSIGWKCMEGWIVLDQRFMARIETTASNSGTFG